MKGKRVKVLGRVEIGWAFLGNDGEAFCASRAGGFRFGAACSPRLLHKQCGGVGRVLTEYTEGTEVRRSIGMR